MPKLAFSFILIIVLTGCNPVAEIKRNQYNVAVAGTTTSIVDVTVPFEEATVQALESGSADIINADLEYIGEISLDVTGSSAKNIILAEDTQDLNAGNQKLSWEIGLTPDIPLDVNLRVASGKMSADLTGLNLTSMDFAAMSGQVEVIVPIGTTPVPALVTTSSGSVTVHVPDGAAFDLTRAESLSGIVTLNIGADVFFDAAVATTSGQVILDLPDDAPVEVIVEYVSSGTVNLPESYTKTDNGSGENNRVGTYVSSTAADASQLIRLRLTVNSGTVTIK